MTTLAPLAEIRRGSVGYVRLDDGMLHPIRVVNVLPDEIQYVRIGQESRWWGSLPAGTDVLVEVAP